MQKQKNFYTLNESIIIILFIVVNYYYFNFFTLNYEYYHDGSKFFYHPINFDFTKLTLPYLQSIFIYDNPIFEKMDNSNTEVFFLRGWTQIGITYLYSFFINLLYFFTDNILFIAFIVNNIFIFIGFRYYKKILVEIMKINHTNFKLLYFFNPILIWYSQGLNKDIFLITLFLPLLYFFYKKDYIKIIFISLVIALIRLPFAFLIPIVFCLIYFKNKYFAIFIVYIISSLVSGYIGSNDYGSRNESVSDFLSSRNGINSRLGLTLLAARLNEDYFIGNILLNPFRTGLLLYDQLRTVFIMVDGRLNLYHLLNLPITLYFIYNFRTIAGMLRPIFLKHKIISLILYFTFAVIIIALMSPYIHARYAAPIIYPLVLAIIYYNLERKYYKKIRV